MGILKKDFSIKLNGLILSCYEKPRKDIKDDPY